MNPDLDAILSADEEARARIEAAERTARARLEAARNDRERRREERRAGAARAVDDEVRRILDEADRLVVERRQRRATYLAERQAAAEGLLTRAAERYVEIVRTGRRGAS